MLLQCAEEKGWKPESHRHEVGSGSGFILKAKEGLQNAVSILQTLFRFYRACTHQQRDMIDLSRNFITL